MESKGKGGAGKHKGRFGEHQLVFFDTETAGFKISEGILELGCVVTDITSRTVRAELGIKVLPKGKRPISDRVASLNGYDPEVWKREAVALGAAMEQLDLLIGDQPTLMVGHSIGFDWRFLSASAKQVGWRPVAIEGTIDTLWMARKVEGLDRHNLEHLCRNWGIETGQMHRALEDAHCCRLVYQALRTQGIKPQVTLTKQWWE
jgi:DNA polymerase III epsilon subunit-like protein